MVKKKVFGQKTDQRAGQAAVILVLDLGEVEHVQEGRTWSSLEGPWGGEGGAEGVDGLQAAAKGGGDDERPDDEDKKCSLAIPLHFSLRDNVSYLDKNTAVWPRMNLGQMADVSEHSWPLLDTGIASRD